MAFITLVSKSLRRNPVHWLRGLGLVTLLCLLVPTAQADGFTIKLLGQRLGTFHAAISDNDVFYFLSV